jgi:enoyl-[acyl-carrier-protein] reductase (NADH)
MLRDDRAIGEGTGDGCNHGHNRPGGPGRPGRAASGIGRACARRLAAAGAEVTVLEGGPQGEVAELAAFLCSEPASFINGASLTMDGGWSAR